MRRNVLNGLRGLKAIGLGLRGLLLSVALCAGASAQDAPVTFSPTADAYVLDGAWAGSNFGSDSALYTRTSNGQNYDSYLKFDTSGVASVASAKLRINASVSANAAISLSAYAVAATGWSESTITWNNRPARGSVLGTTTVNGTSFIYYEIDVTAYLAAEKAAGRQVVSFALHNGQSSNQFVWMHSREATSNGPQLLVTPKVSVVSLLPALSTVALGANTNLTLTLSAPQASDTVVPIAASPAGIVSVPAQVTVPAGATTASVTVGTLAYGQAGVTATLNGSSASAGVNVVPPPLTVTALEPPTFTMTVGATSVFTVRINAAQTADAQIDLAASVPTVLQVPASVIVPAGATSAIFNVIGLTVGNSTITASANGTSRVASVHVSPEPAAVVSLLPTPLPLQQGATGALTVTINVAQETATTVALVNTAPEVAAVPAEVIIAAGTVTAQIAVTAVTPGSAVITASVNGTSAAATVEVTLPPATVSTLTPETLSLPKGTPGTLRVTVSRAPNAVTPVTLSSSDPSVVSVPPQVNIPAGALFADFPVMSNAPGQAIVTATLNGGSASSTIAVAPAELASLVVSPQAPAAETGQSVAFTATGLMTDGTSESFTARVTWTSSAPTVATIAATGVASALAVGQTTIRAAYTFTSVQTGQPVTIEQSTLLTVNPPPLSISAVTPSSAPVESVITLIGAGFDPVPANNQIVFPGINGTSVPASALTATTSQITLKVPALADSGVITLTNTRGTVQSPPFTVAREQDYQLVASPASVTVPQGASAAAQVQLASTGTRAYTGLVTLSAINVPPGVTASFAPAATLSAFQTGTVTFGAAATAAPGTYNVILRADAKEAGQTFSRSAIVSLVVMAAANVTGVKGRFVTPDNNGIAGVIVRADISPTLQPTTTTDAAGNFLLTGLPAGVVNLKMDATPANPLYPIWPYNVTLVANQITVMPDWTISDPPSDDKFTPINNATTNQVVTDPRFPGLSVTLPAGVTITGYDGVVKSRIALERRDLDKLPVTPPPTNARSAYQLYFGTPMGGIPSAPIPVTMPNDIDQDPGSKVDIWYFDGTPMGGTGEWKIAGKGTVSLDGKTISTDPDSGIPRFCGVCGLVCPGVGPPPPPPPPPPDDNPPCDPTDPCSCAGGGAGGSGGGWGGGGGGSGGGGAGGGWGGGGGDSDGGGASGGWGGGTDTPPVDYGARVTVATGQELPSSVDLSCSGAVPVGLGRKYNPLDAYNNVANTMTSFGLGWTMNYDVGLLLFAGPQKRMILPGNVQVTLTDDGSGTYRNNVDPRFVGATMIQVSASTWQVKFKDGRIWRFQSFPGATSSTKGAPPLFLVEKVDSRGNSLQVARNTQGRVTSVGTPQRSMSFTYGANGLISQARDPLGRTVNYTYNARNRLETVTAADGAVTRYTYADDSEFPATAACPNVLGGDRLKTIQRPGRTAVQTLFYGPGRRVLREVLEDGTENRFSYKVVGACVTNVADPAVRCTANCPEVDSWENFQAGWRISGGTIVSAAFTDPRSNTVSQRIASTGSPKEIVNALGQRTQYLRDAQNRIVRKVDPLGRTWQYRYDDKNNVVQTIDPLNRIVDKTYDGTWNKVTSITRYLEDGTPVARQLAYDPNTGNVVRITDPLGNVTTNTYTAQGQLATITPPGSGTTTYGYNAAGDLVSITDPLGNPTLFTADAAGQRIRVTDPLGFDTQTAYTAAGKVLQITDAMLGLTQFNYLPTQNLGSVVNPLNNTIESYQYDLRDRVSAKVDAVGKQSTYQYDAAGNLRVITDRKAQSTFFTYDDQNRLTHIDFPDGVTQTQSYDAVGRLTEIREPAGTVSYAYDQVDRVVRVITDDAAGHNEVAYTYDALDRIVARTVNGIDRTDYAYDKAGRPVSIAYQNQTTTYAWDEAGRLTSKTLPGDIVQKFSYDGLSRVTQIDYLKPDQSSIESIAYTYDANGNRLTKSLSGSSIQETGIVATYDVANRMTSFTLTATGRTFGLSYDDNGNLLAKTDQADPANVTTFRWDARNRLAGIEAPGVSATFEYDPLSRRVSKTVNGQAVRYVFDGTQAIREITGGAVNASLLTTLAIDDVVARYAAAGNRTYLTDALGSVVALAKADQSVQAYYGYSPFGETRVLGDDESNAIQYTGRENDHTGLYYYRARYYDPVLKRFISEDPIGLGGGQNVYTYVRNRPVNFSDPKGLAPAGSCDYYKRICDQTGDVYHCSIAPAVCENFPENPPVLPSGWTPCVRRCLQMKDPQCMPSSCPGDNPDVGCLTRIHLECWSDCTSNSSSY